MSANTIRSPMVMLMRRARAYFMSAAAAASGRVQFDGSQLNPPAAGWTDLGWVENVKRTAGTQIDPLRAGANGAVVKQVPVTLDARVEFDFLEWGKLQMALTARGTPMNVLDPSAGPATAIQPTSTANRLSFESTAGLAAGDLLAVDVDYTGQTGAVGSGLAAAFVSNAANVHNDVDYVRRVTLNVARVTQVTATSATLLQALPGGAPAAGAKAQKVLAFVDREGGNYFPEWALLLVVEGNSGGWVSFYYPQLQVAAPATENSREVQAPLETMSLHASFRALPVTDANDGQQVLCYRTYTPAAGVPLY